MMVLKDGSLYPSKELLAFHAIKMAGDCPVGHLDLVGTTRLVPFALNRGEIVTVARASAFDFPHSLAATRQRLTVCCVNGHMDGLRLEFQGRIHKFEEDAREETLHRFLKIHPEYREEPDRVLARFAVETADYYGDFPAVGSVDRDTLRDERLIDDRLQYPQICRDFNDRPTAALVRVARHYARIQPQVQQASLLRADSYGITIAAENGFDKLFLRLDFETRADNEAEVEMRIRETLAPGYDTRRLERTMQRPSATGA